MRTALLLALSQALQPGPNDVYVRVVDTGPGLCTMTAAPGGHYMVYDAGHWTGDHCLRAAREIVQGEVIDLLILSHSDADHLGAVAELLQEFHVRRIITTGDRRAGRATWEAANDAIANDVRFGASVMNLETMELVPGTTILLGDATVTLVAGWHEWTGLGPTESERLNAISIVVRLDYRGHAILYGGDTVGRRLDDGDTACKDAEAAMVANASQVPLRAEVLIAPHHGGNNGSSRCFIQAVNPTFVIFSAGHMFDHPTARAAQRYIAHGVPVQNMFRTDRGDDEGGFEWVRGRIAGCTDPRGDDDVDIVLRATGAPQVAYRQVTAGC